MSPRLIVIGGPNGAGKTTFAREFLVNEANCRRFLNTDEIARGLSPLDASLSERQAARLLLAECRKLIQSGTTFALESTLSGRAQLNIIRAAKENGFEIRLHYLWLPSAEESERRVIQRVTEGGHDVPREAIYRRYPRSISNFFKQYLPIADTWALWDASRMPADCIGTSATNDANQLRKRYDHS